MDRIIVTIRVGKNAKEYDMELPMDQRIKDLTRDIADSLEGLNPLLYFDPETCCLLNQRNGRRLDPERTLSEECVWNGDLLDVVGRI